MGRGSVKRFIEKRDARTFKLVPKMGSASGDRVFVETTPGADRKRELDTIEEAYKAHEAHEAHVDAPQDQQVAAAARPNPHHVAGEAAKYGILYDDRAYDYTRHLKTTGDMPGAVWVQAYQQPDTEEDCFEQVRELDEAVYQNIKAVVTDPNVLEVLVALEDEAYVQEDVPDDFVCEMNRGGEEEGGCDDILDDFDAALSVQCDADISLAEQPPVDTKKSSFAEIDELRQALLADGPLRIPSELSDFDSDEYFAELEASDDDTGIESITNKDGAVPVRPQLINDIKLSKKTGMPIKPREEPPVQQTEAKENLGTSRNKQESAEEKRQRKSTLKVARKERRTEKKGNRRLFGKSISCE